MTVARTPGREEALFRVGFARLAMKRAAGLERGLDAHLRSTLGPALCRCFDEAPLLGWVPYSVDVRMAEGIAQRRGMEGLRDFVLGNTAEALQAPSLRPLLEGALRVFGVSPATLLRVMPDLWRVGYRHVLEPRIEADGPRAVRLLGTAVCDELLECKAAHVVLSAQAEGAMRVANARVQLGPVEVDHARRTLSLRGSW